MKYNEYKKLEESLNNQSFNKNYKTINIVLKFLSYFGHVVSIFLAFFFISKIISGAVSDNPVAVFTSSIIILAGLELLKRDIFNRFSVSYIKDGSITKLVTPLLIASLLLISGSFYSSINGAREFSSKSEQIDEIKEEKVSQYRDSLSLVYSNRISEVEEEVRGYKSTMIIKDAEQTRINEALIDRGLTRSEKERNTQLAAEKKELNEKISSSEIRISEIKLERDEQIKEHEYKITQKTDSQKRDNSKNSFLFIMISTLIELVILCGVYFGEYYKFRSYREFRDKIEKDPNYQKWLLFDQMLNVIITDESKVNQKLPSNKGIIEMCKVIDTIVLAKDVTEFLKVLVSLGVVKASGSVKYIAKTKEVSQETLRKHFNIE
jgi:hypothetical protein